jgi:hypothetical protein
MLDTRTYEIDFPGGTSDDYTANIIAGTIYAQSDEEGNQFNLMEIIVDHNTDSHVMDRDDMYIKHRSNT